MFNRVGNLEKSVYKALYFLQYTYWSLNYRKRLRSARLRGRKFRNVSLILYPGCQRGFFFRSEAAIVSGEAAVANLPREKKTLWTRQLQTSLPCELVSISVVDWSLYLVPSLSAWWWSNTGFHWINHCKPQEQWKPVYWLEETVNRQYQFGGRK